MVYSVSSHVDLMSFRKRGRNWELRRLTQVDEKLNFMLRGCLGFLILVLGGELQLAILPQTEHWSACNHK